MLPDSKETKLGSSNQEVSSSDGKNTWIVLVPCRTLKCVPTAISGDMDISEDPRCICYDEFSVRVTRITSRIGVS